MFSWKSLFLLFFFARALLNEIQVHQETKTKYPEVVVLPEGLSGDYMILRNTQLPGFELMIVWKINVDKEGKVTPALDLLSKIPKSVTEADKFASDSPHCFRSLLHVLGIQASIETLITSLCKDK